MSDNNKNINIISELLDSCEKSPVKKKAEKVLRKHSLVFASLNDGVFECLFEEKKFPNIITRIDLENNHYNCNCTYEGEGLCIHLLAAALHYDKFYSTHGVLDKVDKNKSDTFTPTFPGLKYQGLELVADELALEYTSSIEIEILKRPPHSPSKWETCLLIAKIKLKGRVYSGNIGNLRQLNFGHGIAAGINMTFFPPQDRQVIRFLAVNAEPEGRVLVLHAETLAEFFHCMIGFEKCFYEGHRMYIHRAHAELVLFYKQIKNEYSLKPGIKVNDSFCGLKNARMIVGRSGCWIGMANDYWWVPATFDILWMRSFFRTEILKCSERQAMEIVRKAQYSGINVENANIPSAPSQKKCTPLFSAEYSPEGLFELQLQFCYADKVISANAPNIIWNGKNAWQRNKNYEYSIEQDLLSLGFIRKEFTGRNIFYLKNQEATGKFLDNVLPNWIINNKKMYIASSLASMISGSDGLVSFRFFVDKIEEIDDLYNIHYKISNASEYVKWKQLIAAVKINSSFILNKNKILGKIPRNLTVFVLQTADIVLELNDDDNILQVSRNAAVFWANAFQKLNGFIPKELKQLCESIPDAPEHASLLLGEKSKKKNKPKNDDSLDIPQAKLLTCEQNIDDSSQYKLQTQLRPYQRDGVLWMRAMLDSRLNFILADEMGLGKTVQTLALILDAMNRYPEMNHIPALVLCPSSLVDNWQMEASKFAPQLTTIIIRGNKRKEIFKKIPETNLIIASYSIAARELKNIALYKYRFLILDEAQRIKNPDTLNAKTCKSIEAFHKLVLTGTPLENSSDELWSIFDFLQPKMLGSIAAFKRRYADIDQNSNIQKELALRAAPFILRRKKIDVEPNLPEKTIQNIYCEMSIEQKKLYENCRERGLDFFNQMLKKGKATKFDLLTNILRLRQICCHPALIDSNNDDLKNIHSAKTELLKELLLESIDSGHRVLLFSQFTSFLTIIRQWLDDEKIKYEYLDGGTKDRMSKVDNFNNSQDIPLFLLSLKAGGVGLNLTSADRVIIYDPWWNPAVEAQATDRTHRIGQTKSVYSMKLIVKNSIEEKILRLQDKKQKIFCNLVDTHSNSLRQLTNEDLQFLLS
jgi:SNF2 family DNA or RNA helicase